MCSRGSIIPLFIKQIKPRTAFDGHRTEYDTFHDVAGRFRTIGHVCIPKCPSGDIFVQKAPAATIETLALALKDLFHAPNDIKIIGARHGEKMYESLCGKEEMSKAEDLGDFYRIPADFRDLNYTKYRATDPPRLQDKEYNSNNTRRLDVEQLKELLLTLPYVQNELETH